MENEEEIRTLKNEYARNWRKRNPEKVKATNERFYKRLKIRKEQENSNKNIQKRRGVKMVVNIDTNCKEQIKQLEELLAKYEQLEEQTRKMQFITIKEFAEMRGCSLTVAQRIFNLHDFPSEDFGKEKVVSLEALRNFYLKKHKKSDYE